MRTAINRNSSRAAEKGFTFIELAVVIVLISILASIALPRFLDLKDDAEAAALQGVAGGFSTGLALVKAKWIAVGNSTSGVSGSDNQVVLDGVAFNVNRFGWPDNVTGGSVELINQTKEECQQVFDNILQSPPLTTSRPDIESRRKAKFGVSVVDGTLSDICRYELIVRPGDEPENAEFYFDYELSTGRVTLTLPDELYLDQ